MIRFLSGQRGEAYLEAMLEIFFNGVLPRQPDPDPI
jgi:hypothetical protein